MAKSQTELDDINRRRKSEVQRSCYAKVIETHIDPETGAGVLVAEANGSMRNIAPNRITAYFFKPRQLKRYFKSEEITSNHARLGVMDRLTSLIDGEKAAKVAPHDLKVGDIVAQIWGYSSRGVNFYQVVGVPHPRKVSLVKIGDRMATGDWMSGTMVPVIPEGVQSTGDAKTYMVSMASGHASVSMGSSYESVGKWDGKPVMIYCD